MPVDPSVRKAQFKDLIAYIDRALSKYQPYKEQGYKDFDLVIETLKKDKKRIGGELSKLVDVPDRAGYSTKDLTKLTTQGAKIKRKIETDISAAEAVFVAINTTSAKDRLSSYAKELEATFKKPPSKHHEHFKTLLQHFNGLISQKSTGVEQHNVFLQAKEILTRVRDEHNKEVDDAHVKIEQLGQQEREKQKEIISKVEAFNTLYTLIKENLVTYELDTREIDSIQKAFNTEYKKTIKNKSDPVAFHAGKLQNLDVIIAQLKEKSIQQNEIIGRKIINTIDQYIINIQNNVTLIKRELSMHSGIQLDDGEQAYLMNFYERIPTDRSYRHSNNLDELRKKQAELHALEKQSNESAARIRQIIANHKEARQTAETADLPGLVDAINDKETADAVKLLIKVAAYAKPEDLYRVLNTNLSNVNGAGLATLAQFLQDKNTSSAALIKIKLAFIKFLVGKGITDYAPFLNDLSKINIVNELAGGPYGKYITRDVLKNKSLLDALQLLQGYEKAQLFLSQANVDSLQADPAKCAVILGVLQVLQRSGLTITPAIFAQLESQATQDQCGLILRTLEVLQKYDIELTDALFSSLLVAPDKCTVIIQQAELNEQRKGMPAQVRDGVSFLTAEQFKRFLTEVIWYFPNQENLASNVAILQILFSQQTQPDQELLTALADANNNPEFQHDEIVRVIKKVTQFIESYPTKDPEVRQSLNKFGQDCLPVLLGPLNLEGKEKTIIKLAAKEFKHQHSFVRVLADILQCITGAFIVVMPVKYALGQNPFFSQSKTQRQTQVEKVFKDQSVDGKDAPAEEGEEEGDDVIPH